MLCRRGFLIDAGKEEGTGVWYRKNPETWPPPASFLTAGPVGFTYYLSKWFRYSLQQYVTNAMSELEAREGVYSLEGYLETRVDCHRPTRTKIFLSYDPGRPDDSQPWRGSPPRPSGAGDVLTNPPPQGETRRNHWLAICESSQRCVSNCSTATNWISSRPGLSCTALGSRAALGCARRQRTGIRIRAAARKRFVLSSSSVNRCLRWRSMITSGSASILRRLLMINWRSIKIEFPDGSHQTPRAD